MTIPTQPGIQLVPTKLPHNAIVSWCPHHQASTTVIKMDISNLVLGCRHVIPRQPQQERNTQ